MPHLSCVAYWLLSSPGRRLRALHRLRNPFYSVDLTLTRRRFPKSDQLNGHALAQLLKTQLALGASVFVPEGLTYLTAWGFHRKVGVAFS